MKTRNIVRVGGQFIKTGGGHVQTPAWRSAQTEGGNDTTGWFVSSILNDGRFTGFNYYHFPDDTTSTAGSGYGRTTTYVETGWKDVAIEFTTDMHYEDPTEPYDTITCFPACKVTPGAFEFTLGTYIEHLGNGQWVHQYLTSNPKWWSLAIALGPSGEDDLNPSLQPRTLRQEVIGRMVRNYEIIGGNPVYKFMGILPKAMVDSTLHGITQDVPGYLDNPPYPQDEVDYLPQSGVESDWKVWPIKDFSDLVVSNLGSEMVVQPDIESAVGINSTANWLLKTTRNESLGISPMAECIRTDSNFFTTTNLEFDLTTPMVAGDDYRLTFGVHLSGQANNEPVVVGWASRTWGYLYYQFIASTGTDSAWFPVRHPWSPTIPFPRTEQGGYTYTHSVPALTEYDGVRFAIDSRQDGADWKADMAINYVSVKRILGV